MKKLFLVGLICLTASCTYLDRKVKLDMSLEQEKSDVAIDKSFEILVIDERRNKKLLGTKELGEQKVKIFVDGDLATFLQNQLTENLLQKGFKLGIDKTITLKIKAFDYKAKREVVVGRSKAGIKLQLAIKDNQTGKKFTRNFEVALKNKHFIAPLESTDAGIINEILQEVLQSILDDEQFMQNLAE